MNATITRANVKTFIIEGGELVINNNGDRPRYMFNTHRISAREFARIAALKGVRV